VLNTLRSTSKIVADGIFAQYKCQTPSKVQRDKRTDARFEFGEF